MAERFLLQCHHCHSILSQQPTKNEIGPERIICPHCKAWVPTPYISWKNAPLARRCKMCLTMFVATAGGLYLVMMLMIVPLAQSVCQLLGLPYGFLFDPQIRTYAFLHFPVACGILATWFMRRHYIKGYF